MKKALNSILYCTYLSLILLIFSFSASAEGAVLPTVTETLVNQTDITLCWTEVPGADGYELSLKQSDGTLKFIATADRGAYTVEKLTPDSEYTFVIRAYEKAGENSFIYGEYSVPYTRKTKMNVPKNLAFVSSETDSITLKWDAVAGAEYYNIHYGISGEDGYTLAGSTKETTFKIEGLDNSNRYKIKIMAKREGNTSSYSELIRLIPSPSAVPVPETVSKDGASVTIKWNKAPRATEYNIYVSNSPDGKFTKVETTDKTTFTYKKETPKKAYYFKVAPVIKNDFQYSEGPLSKTKKATIGNISIEKPETIRKGEYVNITVPYYNSKVKWKSSNKSVLKKSGDRFYAVGKGTTTLTATYKKKFKVRVKIKVTAPTVSCMAAVYDVKNKEYLFKNKINDRCYPASITKLITALVALKYMDVNDTITVGSELALTEALSSRCDIKYGEKYRLGDILYGLLLPSGGDAAYTIAVNVARKVAKNPNMSYTAAKNYFVSLMNKYMKSIGATGTHCVNPHGYPVSGHYSTVHDLVLVANKVLKNKTLKKITSTPYKYVTPLNGGEGHSWRTTNSLLNSYAYYYSPYAHGMKTGTVDDYYTGIISAATKDGKTLITVVIGCESYNDRYNMTYRLYNAYLY